MYERGSNILYMMGLLTTNDTHSGRYLQLPENEIPKLVSLNLRTSYILTQSENVYVMGIVIYIDIKLAPTLIKLPEKIVDISTHNYALYALFLSDTGNVYSQGNISHISDVLTSTSRYQPLLGYSNIIKVVATENFICALDNRGDIYGCGALLMKNKTAKYSKPTKMEEF